MSLSTYALKRLGSLGVIWVGLTVMTFSLAHVAPENPARIYVERRLGREPTPVELALAEHQLGLDKSLVVQYQHWLSGAVRGEFGMSWSYDEPVSSVVGSRLGATVRLAVAALVGGLLLAVPIGVLTAACRGSRVDRWCRLGAAILSAFPGFVLAYVLIYVFGVKLHLLPTFGSDSARHLVLPVLTLALLGAADLTRLVRATMLDVLGEEYIRTARAKGVSGTAVLFSHALRNALVPVVSVAGVRLGFLLTGAFIVEYVFALQGLGQVALAAINNRDYPLMQGFVLVTGTVFVTANLGVDLAYAWLDPRIRLSSGT